MKPSRDGDFESSVRQLIKLLRKIMKSYPDQLNLTKSKPQFQDQGVNLNVFFFNLLPLSDEDWDELEEIYETYFHDDDPRKLDINTQLNAEDREFLKKHGIQF